MDAWTKRKFYDITTTYSGLTYSPDDIRATGTLVLRSSNVKGGEIIDTDNVYVDARVINCENVLPDDVIVVVRNGSRELIGKHALVRQPMPDTVIGAFMTGLRGNGAFAHALLDTDQFGAEIKKSLGATINQITGRDFSMMVFGAPGSGEMSRIGEFFRALDALIAANQRKANLLQQLKRAYLQELFPAPKRAVPRLRFPGFTDAWEQRKLGDIADIVGGGTPSTDVGSYWDGEVDWYAPAEIGKQIYVTGSQKQITELGLQESSAKMLPVGTVLFTSRAGIGNTAILGKTGATNQGFQSIVPHESDLDSYFIFSRTHELKRYGEIMGAGSTFVEVSGKQMAQMPLLMPSMPEQQQVGRFFEFLDHLIALHQRKCDLLDELKRGYLQKMFV